MKILLIDDHRIDKNRYQKFFLKIMKNFSVIDDCSSKKSF